MEPRGGSKPRLGCRIGSGSFGEIYIGGVQANDEPTMRLRVKVYRLSSDGKWDDQGTGHVTVDYLERSEDLGLIVIDEEDNDTILMHRISSDDIYRRQEDTIISWRDPELATELALSFQEATGCSYIWDRICGVQRNFHFSTLGNDAFHNASRDIRELPPVELSTLPLILKTVAESGVADQIRVAELILQDQEFFPKVMDLFKMSEDLENMDSLHIIFKLVKGIILLNSLQIFDKIFSDELILDVIGVLEYDPEVSKVQRHRAFLKEHVVFKEVISIKGAQVLSKIHQSYRIGYIKDVILPKVLDEATVASLNSIIHSNNAAVISVLKDDTSFIQELFAKMRSPKISIESKRNLVLFLQEFCSLSKSLQLAQQLRLFRELANEGIFDIVTDALQSQDKRLALTGTDILILFLNQDPNLLRNFVIQQEGNTLFRLLVKGMITDFGEDMHCQFLEILRILLESYTSSGAQSDALLDIFYEKYLDQLIDVITSSCPKSIPKTRVASVACAGRIGSQAQTKPEILSNICELLCFCVLHHPYRIKCSFILNNVIEKVLLLTQRREKYLVVAAVRFMRTIISRNDEYLLRHIVKSNLMKPIVEAFIVNGSRYNMLHSGVLELLEFIRKENIKTLIVYLVDIFWDQMSKFHYLGTIQALKTKYEQSLEKCDIAAVSVADPRKRIDERALEKEEEDYFNEDSDEEDSACAGMSRDHNEVRESTVPNGTSVSHPPFRVRRGGLVDYEDDDDEEDYTPPSREDESSCGSDRSSTIIKTKRESTLTSDGSSEERELRKKRKLDKHRIDGAVVFAAACSTCSYADSPSKTVPAASVPISTDANSMSSDRKKDEDSNSTEKNCSNLVSTPADVRPSSGEECSHTSINSSSSEVAVNGANASHTEPYSVR